MVASLWNRRIGRLSYTLGFFVCAAIILCLPTIVNRCVLVILGSDPMLSAPRMLFRAYGLTIGVATLAVPLALLTRYRLHDLDLSSSFLILNPLWALQTLAAMPATSLLFWGLLPANPLAEPSLWVALVSAIVLMILPGRTSGRPSSDRVFAFVRRWTSDDGSMGRGAFQIWFASIVAVYTFLVLASPIVVHVSEYETSVRFILPSVKLLDIILMIVLVGATIRRLNNLGLSNKLVFIFPLGLPQLLPLIHTPALAQYFFASIWMIGLVAWGVASVLMLVYLLFFPGRDDTTSRLLWPAPVALCLAAMTMFSSAAISMVREWANGETEVSLTDNAMWPLFNAYKPVVVRRIKVGEEVKRGEIIAIRHPSGKGTWIGRVIGIPGDTVEAAAGLLRLNGDTLPRSAGATYTIGPKIPTLSATIPTYTEQLPSGPTYTVFGAPRNNAYASNTSPIFVPPEGLFLVGDNRNDSKDSRIPLSNGGLGIVPKGNVIGFVAQPPPIDSK
jgi:signal peptidase I